MPLVKPDIAETAISRTGDVWLLGSHRIMCGDSLQLEQVNKLLAGEKIDLIFTDPPYNVNYRGRKTARLKIINDQMTVENYQQFLNAMVSIYRQTMKPTASLYICHASSFQRELQNALEANDFSIRAQLIWAKNHFAGGFNRYRYQHELIFYCYLKGQQDSWYGDRRQSTLWKVPKPGANRGHPTMKPVALIEMALFNSSQCGDLVIDLFGGSGSTLMACEKNNRRCYTMEIMPMYVDFTIQRWQQLTGQSAILESTKQPFSDIQYLRKNQASTQLAANDQTVSLIR